MRCINLKIFHMISHSKKFNFVTLVLHEYKQVVNDIEYTSYTMQGLYNDLIFTNVFHTVRAISRVAMLVAKSCMHVCFCLHISIHSCLNKLSQLMVGLVLFEYVWLHQYWNSNSNVSIRCRCSSRRVYVNYKQHHNYTDATCGAHHLQIKLCC
jgi:hypothetical protein